MSSAKPRVPSHEPTAILWRASGLIGAIPANRGAISTIALLINTATGFKSPP